MSYLPYAQHYVTDDDVALVTAVLRGSTLTQGPLVPALESRLCVEVGCEHAIAVNSGTMALHIAYKAARYPLIRTPAITFVATINAATLQNPVALTDCDPITGLALAPASVPVWLGGQAPPHPFGEIADTCHALGAPNILKHCYAACISLHPAKHITAGEGGAILTNDPHFAEECRLLRDHGRDGKFCVRAGAPNGRMAEINAALALSQLTRLKWNVETRREIATRYDAAFKGSVESVPHAPDSARHLYQIRLRDAGHRDQVQAALHARGVGTAIHYPPLYAHPAWSHLGDDTRFPGAAEFAARALTIPLYPTLTDSEQRQVIDAVLEVAN